MQIEQKIALSRTPICLFREGSFFKLYNHSFYVAKELLGIKLNPQIKRSQKLNRMIICGGFPVTSIARHLPNATPTLFGYELIQPFDLSNYKNWFIRQCATQMQQTPLTVEQIEFILTYQGQSDGNDFLRELKQHFLNQQN